MIDYNKAMEIAISYVNSISKKHDFILQPDKIIEKKQGWIFFYTTKQYLQTGNVMSLVPGMAPFLVRRSDGSIKEFSSHEPYERQLEDE